MKSDISNQQEYLDQLLNLSKQQEVTSQTNANSGHWNDQEHHLYLDFLKQVRGADSNYKKGQPLFKRMSQVIGTRSPSQCRSHHQKFNPFNPTIKKHKRRHNPIQMKVKKNNDIKFDKLPLLKSKQIMRQYFASLKGSSEITDEEVLSESQL